MSRFTVAKLQLGHIYSVHVFSLMSLMPMDFLHHNRIFEVTIEKVIMT